MAYITRFFRKVDKKQLSNQDMVLKFNNKVFVFIVILAALVLVVDYVLVMEFINIIKQL